MFLNDCICLAQAYLQNSPLIVLGSGASVPYGLPSMKMLALEICKKHSSIDDEGFDNFCDLLNDGYDLESALDKSTLKEETLNLIREIVWECINKCDLKFFENNTMYNDFAIAKLFNKVIKPAPNKVSVVTTNYDRIAEYAADVINATIITGFEGSLIRKLEVPSQSTFIKRIRARERIVEIWKVHGSLDWFFTDDGEIRSYPLSTKIPPNHSPMIIPPGKDKYNKTHSEPYRTIIAQADTAFLRAGSYLCIGYGFNDEHIQPKLLNEIRQGKAVVVLVKKMTDACRKYIIDSEIKKYIIFESADNGKTAVYTNGWNGLYDGEFWKLNEFINIW